MNREETLKEFDEKIVKSLLYECKDKFEEKFNENEETVKALIISGLKKLIEKAKELKVDNKEYKIAVFQFEFLRINVFNESYRILAHGYNSLWYLDKDSIYEEIDLKFLFEPFVQLKEKLIKEKKIYMGKVNNYDIQKVILDSAAECYKNISESARIWFWNFDEEEWMQESSIESFYVIKWGEYQGKSEILFAMDNREKDIKELLKLKEQPEAKLPFVYSVWKNSILEDGDLIKQNLLFINFKGSKLKKLNFSESDILGAQFKDSHIKKCEFNSSKLIGTSFENAKIEDSNFKSANCTGVEFVKTEFKYVDFTNAILKNANFTNAKFEGVSFEGADLEDSIFNERDVPFLHLSPEQLQTIYIDGGREE